MWPKPEIQEGDVGQDVEGYHSVYKNLGNELKWIRSGGHFPGQLSIPPICVKRGKKCSFLWPVNEKDYIRPHGLNAKRGVLMYYRLSAEDAGVHDWSEKLRELNIQYKESYQHPPLDAVILRGCSWVCKLPTYIYQLDKKLWDKDQYAAAAKAWAGKPKTSKSTTSPQFD